MPHIQSAVVSCGSCGKKVSGWDGPEFIVRACVQCPECIEAEIDAACINCDIAFNLGEIRHYFGAPNEQAGPFCKACDRLIKVHTGFTLQEDRTMTAREKFTIGQRVKLSDEGRQGRIESNVDREGAVLGFGHKPWLVTVLKDGTKTRVSYHMDFWEPVTP